MTPITARKDLSGRFGPARQQCFRDTCLAFAMSDAHASARGPWCPLCCEYLFYRAKQRDKTPPDQGTTFSAVCTALEKDGQPVETAWPYLEDLPADLTQWKPPSEVGKLYQRGSKKGASGFDDIWTAVEGGTPVVVGLSYSDAFLEPDEGVVDSDEPEDSSRLHVVVAVASGARAQKKYLKMRNSWGDEWGQDGYAWVSEGYLVPRLMVAVTLN